MYYLYSLEQIGVQRQTNFQENYFRMELTLCECFKILTMSLSMHGSQFVVIAFQLIYERETCNHTKVLKILKSLKLLNNAPSKVILTLCDLYLLNMCVIFFLVFSRFTYCNTYGPKTYRWESLKLFFFMPSKFNIKMCPVKTVVLRKD